MNKLTTVSLVALLGVAGGGGYLAMNPDKAEEYAQYLPEPVTSFLADVIPAEYQPAFLSKTQVEDEAIVAEPADEQTQNADVFMQDDSVANIDQAPQEQAQDDGLSLGDIQGALGSALPKDINAPVQAEEQVQAPVVSQSNDPKVAGIEKEINGVTAKISQIDEKNQQLQEKFQNILKKNRELAKELQAIDEKLANKSN